MSWEVITSLIGSGVISAALSAIITNMINKKYESHLQAELENLKTTNQQKLYVTQKQYDLEVEIYENIWERLNNCLNQSTSLYPRGLVYGYPKGNNPDYIKQSQEKYSLFAKTYNDYSTYIDAKAPFIKKEYYDKLLEIRGICYRVGSIFEDEEIMKYTSPTYAAVINEPMLKGDKDFTRKESHEKLEQLRNELIVRTRDYLESLRIKE